MTIKTLMQSSRLPFLVLTPVCVFLGASSVAANQVHINPYFLGLALFGALFAHISVNTLNEYQDYKSGLDLITTKTPFSGGSGALPNAPEMANAVLALAIVSLIITLMIGSFFVAQYGSGLVPLGLTGVLVIITYTSWINKHPYLCLLAPGLGFGFLMVIGTQYVLTGEYFSLSWVVATVPFFLVNNLLLLNQYPDIEADAVIGRNHFPIAFGVTRSNSAYGLFLLATILVIAGGSLSGYLPRLSLLALLPVPLALFSLHGANKYGGNIGAHPEILAANVAMTILTPLLLGISLIYG